jgi:hypothetical protein
LSVRNGRPRRWAAVAACTGLAACETRRPTQAELDEWNRMSNQILVWTVVWEVAALAAITFGIWDLLSRRRGREHGWSPAVGMLVLIMGTLMLVLPMWSFVRLWTA